MDGQILNKRYKLLSRIGSGGMGVVYKANCNLLDRFVAVKVLDNKFGNDKEFIKRFKVEAQSAASLSHQNIVSVYDVGYEGNIQYIVMEYVEGVTLKEYIENKGVLDWKEAIKISIQVSQAIEHAHKNKIVHRDIKPHNILISKSGEVKVTDFGIAKAITSNTITVEGSAIGSVHYLSPEQAKGELVGIKSDIYSLGITMYEMVTGNLPFEGATQIAVVLKHLNQKPKPPIKIQKNIPKELNHIILKAIKKDQNYRYQHASDVVVALNKLLNQLEDVHFKKKLYEIKIKLFKKLLTIKTKFVNNYINKNRSNTKLHKTKIFSRLVCIIKKFLISNKNSLNKIKCNKKVTSILKASKVRKNQLIIVGICALLFITITLIKISFGNNSNNKVFKVKYYIGKDYRDTVEELKAVGWNIKYINLKKMNPDSKVEENKIIKQNPSKGKRIKINVDTIALYYSSGKERLKTLRIPDIIGDNYKESNDVLKEMGFKYIKVHGEESNKSKESVIRVIPQIGELVKINKEIDIYYSLGENNNYIEIPDLVGLSNFQAQGKLKNLGLNIGTIKPQNSNNDAIVISQNPKSGFLGKVGQSVDLFFKEQESKEPTAKPSPKPISGETNDNGIIQLSKSWFTSRIEPYYVKIEYISVNNSDKMAEASWTYNLLEQVPNSVSMNNLTFGEVYRRVIKVNDGVVDDRVVKIN